MQSFGSSVGGARAGVVASVLLAAGFIALASADRAVAQLNIAAEARATLLAKSYNASGQQLFVQLAAKPGNIVFSPYSVGTAMTMALTGARGDTASEMARVLMQRMAREAIDTANAEMIAILKGYDHSGDPPVCPSGAALKAGKCEGRPVGDSRRCNNGMTLVGQSCIGDGVPGISAKLLVANALMLLKRGDLISEDYATTLKTRYGAEVFRQASLDDINAWVSRNTEGKIAKLIDSLDDNAAAVLLNAVYFKARWASPFDKKLTKDDTFNLSRSQKVQVPLMNEGGSFSLVSRGGYRAIRLPYEVAEIGMIVVLPDDIEGVGDVARRLGQNELADLFAALRNGQTRKPVKLALPRFKTEYKADLVPPFEAGGMHKAFDAASADFSGMTNGPVPPGTIFIGQIAHRAVIDVSEESTEAAAATGAVMTTASAMPLPQPPEAFRVDRPFLFYLVDDVSGAILFQGRITDPR